MTDTFKLIYSITIHSIRINVIAQPGFPTGKTHSVVLNHNYFHNILKLNCPLSSTLDKWLRERLSVMLQAHFWPKSCDESQASDYPSASLSLLVNTRKWDQNSVLMAMLWNFENRPRFLLKNVRRKKF